MFVKDHMTSNPITIAKNMSILDALDLMRRHHIRRLPVTDAGYLQGLVTEQDLLKVTPSPASTLSIFEMNYLISKMTAKEVMNTKPACVSPDTPIEEAARIMHDEKMGELLVIEGKELVGIITQTDLFEAIIHLFGFRKPGLRLTLELEDRVGELARLTQLIKEENVNIISVAARQAESHQTEVAVRLATADEKIVDRIREAGITVRHVD